MSYLSKEQQSVLTRQLYNRARDIDVAIYNAAIDPASKEFVLDCLMFYRNSDGGFGNGLEIDNYNPHSSVYQVYEAFRILDELDFDSSEENELFSDLVQKACNYLFNKCLLQEGRWNPLTPSNNDYAHSKEYHYDGNEQNRFGYHPTAALIGYILRFVRPTKVYYKKAMKLLNGAFSYIEEKEEVTEYDWISFGALLGCLKKLNLYPNWQQLIEDKLIHTARIKVKAGATVNLARLLANCSIPLDLKPYVEQQLDTLVAKIAPHGLWEYEKSWDMPYPEEESAKLKWLGAISVDHYLLLKTYHWIEK